MYAVSKLLHSFELLKQLFQGTDIMNLKHFLICCVVNEWNFLHYITAKAKKGKEFTQSLFSLKKSLAMMLL